MQGPTTNGPHALAAGAGRAVLGHRGGAAGGLVLLCVASAEHGRGHFPWRPRTCGGLADLPGHGRSSAARRGLCTSRHCAASLSMPAVVATACALLARGLSAGAEVHWAGPAGASVRRAALHAAVDRVAAWMRAPRRVCRMAPTTATTSSGSDTPFSWCFEPEGRHFLLEGAWLDTVPFGRARLGTPKASWRPCITDWTRAAFLLLGQRRVWQSRKAGRLTACHRHCVSCAFARAGL